MIAIADAQYSAFWGDMRIDKHAPAPLIAAAYLNFLFSVPRWRNW